MADVCPSCGVRDLPPVSPSGWCDECVVERAAANYSSQDLVRASVRSASWGKRSQTRTDAQLATLRQQRRRLIATVKPTRDAASSDPWEIATSAIGTVRRLQQSYAQGRSELEDVVEALRRLAWGPSDDDRESWHTPMRKSRRHQIPGQLALFGEALEAAA